MQLSPPPTTEPPIEPALLTPDEFRALVARVRRNTERSSALIGFTIYSALIVFIVGVLGTVWVGFVIPLLCTVLFVVVLAVSLRMDARRALKDNQKMESILQFVMSTQDVNMLGPILNLKDANMRSGHLYSHINKTVDEAVLRLLPLVQASHGNSLNNAQRSGIRGYIWDGSSYARGVLHALEQIGDQRDLPAIKQLAKVQHISEDVRAAAAYCGQVIQARMALEESKDVLLRPDRKPDAVATLLRPSVERQDPSPQHLLRALASDDANPPA